MSLIIATSDTSLALDNDIFTHLRNKQPYIVEKIKKHFIETRELPTIPSLVLFEANYGIQKALVTKKISIEQANYQILQVSNLSNIHFIIDFNQRSSEIAAHIFARLSQSDRNKHWRDLFIVATAIANGYGLATQNRKDMELISKHLPLDMDLRIAIWKK